jgi:transcriptional regulator with XRE-family HTH domain/tetratricopeptide (TPR) repeat protein
MAINQQLLAARNRMHWSQKRAAQACNVDVQTFFRWEHGEQEPRGYNLEQLCEVFGVSAEQLGYSSDVQIEEDVTARDDREGSALVTLTPQQVADLLPFIEDRTMDKRDALRSILTAATNASSAGDILSWEQPAIKFSRRKALETIVGAAAVTMGLSQSAPLHPQEIILICASNIPLCWQLYFDGALSETKKHIVPYLYQLSSLVTTGYQKQAAPLASQAYQLSALIEILFHNLGTALDHAKQAVTFARLTDDASLLTAAYIRLAVVYSNLHRSQHRLAAYETALQLVPNTSPLLQARVYAGLTETHSVLGNKQAAFHYLDLTVLPARYEEDPNFSYTHFDPWSIQMYEREMWMNLGQPNKAWETLETASLSFVEQGLTVNRVDLTIKQAETAVLLGNLEQSHMYFTRATEGTKALGSHLLAEDLQKIYVQMKQMWPGEQRLFLLEEQLR